MYVQFFSAIFSPCTRLFQTVRLLNRTNFQKYSIEKLLFCTFYSQQIASNSPLSTYVHSSTYFLHLIGTLGVSNGPRIDPCTFIRVLSALYVYKIFEKFHPVCLFRLYGNTRHQSIQCYLFNNQKFEPEPGSNLLQCLVLPYSREQTYRVEHFKDFVNVQSRKHSNKRTGINSWTI